MTKKMSKTSRTTGKMSRMSGMTRTTSESDGDKGGQLWETQTRGQAWSGENF